MRPARNLGKKSFDLIGLRLFGHVVQALHELRRFLM
jgi:hypothetical protein